MFSNQCSGDKSNCADNLSRQVIKKSVFNHLQNMCLLHHKQVFINLATIGDHVYFEIHTTKDEYELNGIIASFFSDLVWHKLSLKLRYGLKKKRGASPRSKV